MENLGGGGGLPSVPSSGIVQESFNQIYFYFKIPSSPSTFKQPAWYRNFSIVYENIFIEQQPKK
jgi:hypothetical protein